jgi:hypothetical protein
VDPNQRLIRVSYLLEARDIRQGRNDVGIQVAKRQPFMQGFIQVEKMEIKICYSD